MKPLHVLCTLQCFIKWGTSFRWSFHPNSTWGSIETMIIRKTNGSSRTPLYYWSVINSFDNRYQCYIYREFLTNLIFISSKSWYKWVNYIYSLSSKNLILSVPSRTDLQFISSRWVYHGSSWQDHQEIKPSLWHDSCFF